MPTSEPPVVPLPPWSVLSPPGVSFPVSFPVSGLVSVVVPSPNRAEAFFSVPSRLRFRQLKSPVPRARIFKPSMFLAMVNSFSVAAPALFLIPMERMARSAIFTAMPWSTNSRMHATMSVIIPLIAPRENGVL